MDCLLCGPHLEEFLYPDDDVVDDGDVKVAIILAFFFLFEPGFLPKIGFFMCFFILFYDLLLLLLLLLRKIPSSYISCISS